MSIRQKGKGTVNNDVGSYETSNDVGPTAALVLAEGVLYGFCFRDVPQIDSSGCPLD